MIHQLHVIVLAFFLGTLPCIGTFDLTATESRAAYERDRIEAIMASDQQLEGAGVLRREAPDDLPLLGETWTQVVQGSSEGKGVCSYSLEFYEPVELATPKFGWLSAVDPLACRFEFQVGVIVNPIQPSTEGGKSDRREVEADYTVKEELPERRLGFASPGALGDLAESSNLPALAEAGRKMTVYGSWQDPDPVPSIEVVKVLTAVKSRVNGNTVVGGNCLHDRWWRTSTGWGNASSGQWNDTSCTFANHRLKGRTNARYSNSTFPACWGENAFIYYDRLWAKVTTTNDPFPAGYYYGLVGTWADGSRCTQLLKWSAWAFYPGEYWGF